MRKAQTLAFMLSKRLYKKITFLLILLLIPTMVFSFRIVANRSDGGMLTIALARADSSDELSKIVTDDLKESSKLIRFIECSPHDAKELVRNGTVDAAWVFRENTTEHAVHFASSRSLKDFIVTVFEREETVPLRLSREKLTSSVYKFTSKYMYLDFIRDNLPHLDTLSDDELFVYYDTFEKSNELFAFSDSDASGNALSEESSNYLITPIRGILAVILLLGALASVMFFIRDRENGVFARIPENRLTRFAFGYHLITTLNLAVFVLIAIMLSGLGTTIARELLLIVLYAVCCTALSVIIGKVSRNIKTVGALLLLTTVITLAVCPIFFDLREAKLLQMLLPTTHYLNAAYSNVSLNFMLIYAVAATLLAFIPDILNTIKRRCR